MRCVAADLPLFAYNPKSEVPTMHMRFLLSFTVAALIVGIASRPMEAQAPLMPPPVIDAYVEAPGVLASRAEETQTIGKTTQGESARLVGPSPWAEPIPPAHFSSSQSSWQRGALIGAGVGAAAGLVGATVLTQAIRKAVGGDNTPLVIGATVTGAAVGAMVGLGIGWVAANPRSRTEIIVN